MYRRCALLWQRMSGRKSGPHCKLAVLSKLWYEPTNFVGPFLAASAAILGVLHVHSWTELCTSDLW